MAAPPRPTSTLRGPVANANAMAKAKAKAKAKEKVKVKVSVQAAGTACYPNEHCAAHWLPAMS
jgi:hypothetical protein